MLREDSNRSCTKCLELINLFIRFGMYSVVGSKLSSFCSNRYLSVCSIVTWLWPLLPFQKFARMRIFLLCQLIGMALVVMLQWTTSLERVDSLMSKISLNQMQEILYLDWPSMQNQEGALYQLFGHLCRPNIWSAEFYFIYSYVLIYLICN